MVYVFLRINLWAPPKSLLKNRLIRKVKHNRSYFVGRIKQLVLIFEAVKKFFRYLALAAFLLPIAAKAQFETARDSVVQLYGVIMTADSLVGIPAVSITVKGQNRGTITNDQGVFSIVDIPGVTKARLFDINGSGVIVGWYQDGLATHGFVGTPVPEPASLGMVSLGLLLTVWAVKLHTS